MQLCIVEERNVEISALEQDLSYVSEIMTSLASLISEQGEKIPTDQIETTCENVCKATENLASAASWKQKLRGTLLDVATVSGGTVLGTLGFLGGPIVGTVTLVGGITAGISIVALRRRIVTRSPR